MTWRWLVPVATTGIAVSVSILSRDSLDWSARGQMLLFLGLMLLASPTILYYRLLIFIGERLLPPWPIAGGLLLVLAGAILPPLLHNGVVDQSTLAHNFVNPAPAGIGIIAIDKDALGHPDLILEQGFARCDDTCLRLLFGRGGQRVVVGDSSAQSDMQSRFMRGSEEPADYPTAQILHVETRPICPPITTIRDDKENAPFPGGPLLESYDRQPRQVSVEERVIALIAAGQCLVAEPGAFRQAGLRLGTRSSERGAGSSIVPDSFGLLWADFHFVDRRDGSAWNRLSQRVIHGLSVRWTYPFGFLPRRFSWFAASPVVSEWPEDAADREQPWRWAGVTLPIPAYIGDARIRDLLGAAVAMPPDAPRDARHQLAWQYLQGLSRRRPESADRALLPLIIADPRVPATDLQPLEQLARVEDATAIGRALIDRMRRTEPGRGEIRRVAFLVSRLPRAAWPALLPALRGLAADPARAGEAREAFTLFAAGDAADAASLLGLFRSNWPPLSLAHVVGPTAMQQQAAMASADRVRAYLVGLCMLADKSDAIRPTLIAASRADAPRPGSGNGLIYQIWQTMAAMGIPVERLAAERNLGPGERDEIAQLTRGSTLRCPPQHPRGRSGALPL